MSLISDSVDKIRSLWDGMSRRSAITQAWDHGLFAGTFNSEIGMTRENVLAISTIFACVRIISTSLSMVPFDLWQEDDDGDRKMLVDEPEHYLFGEGPNDEATRVEFFQTLLIDLLLDGNGYNWVPRNGKGRPLEIWNLEPQRCTFNRVRGEMVYYVSRNDMIDIPERLYQGDDMWHLRYMSRDSIEGLNAVRNFAKTFELARSQKDFQKALYDNNMAISGIVQTEQQLEKKEINLIEKRLAEKYTGAKKAGRPLVLPFNLKYQNTSITPEDAQMIPTFNYNEREIVKIFGVPLHMVANLEKATFSNIEQQQLEFVMNTLKSWAVLIQESARKHILNRQQRNKGWYYEFDLDQIQQAIMKDRFTAWQIGINAGFLTRNEARVAEGRKRLPGLDEPLSPLNMVGGSNDKPGGVDDGEGEAAEKPAAPDAPPPKKNKVVPIADAPSASAKRALLSLVTDAMRKNFTKIKGVQEAKPAQFDEQRAIKQTNNDIYQAMSKALEGLRPGTNEDDIRACANEVGGVVLQMGKEKGLNPELVEFLMLEQRINFELKFLKE